MASSKVGVMRIKRALKEYIKDARVWDPATQWQTVITDALADLRHLAQAEGVDFYACDKRAYGHYSTEVVEAREGASRG